MCQASHGLRTMSHRAAHERLSPYLAFYTAQLYNYILHISIIIDIHIFIAYTPAIADSMWGTSHKQEAFVHC